MLEGCRCKYENKRTSVIQNLPCNVKLNSEDNKYKYIGTTICYDCLNRVKLEKFIEILKPNYNIIDDNKNLFKPYKQSKKKYYNLIDVYAYNINYDIVLKYHYNYYLINTLLLSIRRTHNFNNDSIEYKTYNNTRPKRVVNLVSYNGIELTTDIINTEINKITTSSYQYPADFLKKSKTYDVNCVIYHKTKWLYNGYKNNKTTNKYTIYRLRIEKILILEQTDSVYQDIYSLLFYDDDVIKDLFNKNLNFVLIMETEYFEVNNLEVDKYLIKVKYDDVFKTDIHKLIIHIDVENTVRHQDLYRVSDYGKSSFDKCLLSKKQLENLFNPVIKTDEYNNKKKKYLDEDVKYESDESNDSTELNLSNSEISLLEKSNTKSDDKLDDKLDNKLQDKLNNKLDDKLQDKLNNKLDDKLDNKLNNKLDDKLDNKLYDKLDNKLNNFEFSYNKYIYFTDENKSIIEHSIYSKLRHNKKMSELFNGFNIINIIKNYTKSYTSQKYFNIILYDNNNKRISPQYHIYLNNYNEIDNITEIKSLI